jgi:hypothetical protein
MTQVLQWAPPQIVLEIFWISRSKHFIQSRTCWGSFQTWSQHINDLLIEMCWVSHNLWRQITLFLESWVNPGSPGHRGQVTLQHTEAYRVTRAQVPGYPPIVSLGRHRSDRCLSPVRPVTASAHSCGDFALLVPWMCEYVTNSSPAI